MVNPFDRDEYPTEAPDFIVVGRFIGWKLNLDYDAVDYTLKYIFSPITSVDDADNIEVVGTVVTLDDGEDYWVFEIDTAASVVWTLADDADYRWDLVVTEVGPPEPNVASISSGFTSFFRTNSDRRSHAEIMLGQINALLEGRAKSDVASYSIKSRSLTKLSIEELMKWRDYYVNEIRRTGGSVDTGGKRIKTNTVQVRFE